MQHTLPTEMRVCYSRNLNLIKVHFFNLSNWAEEIRIDF